MASFKSRYTLGVPLKVASTAISKLRCQIPLTDSQRIYSCLSHISSTYRIVITEVDSLSYQSCPTPPGVPIQISVPAQLHFRSVNDTFSLNLRLRSSPHIGLQDLDKRTGFEPVCSFTHKESNLLYRSLHISPERVLNILVTNPATA